MPKELVELTMFNAGTICNPSVTDIPLEAASDSLNIDPMSEDGKLKGIPVDTKIEDNCGHEKNVLLQNITDPTKHDLISYKNSDNTVYITEDVYSGSSTEAEINGANNGDIVASTDEVAMEAMQGSVYLGQGTGDREEPQWIGRLDHGQFGSTATNSLIMEEDSLYPPNVLNETSTACSDGNHIFMAAGGLEGSYYTGTDSLKYASGEITKVRISDGKVIARSDHVLGYVNAICTSYDKSEIWVICTQKWNISNYTEVVLDQEILIYKLNASDLKVANSYTTNLNTAVKTARGGDENWEALTNDTDHTGNRWEDEDSFWEGASAYEYQGTFSSILDILRNDDTTRLLWVCTTAGAVFNIDISDLDDVTSLDFTDRTLLGFGYHTNTETLTEAYMPPGGLLNTEGGFYKNDLSAWLFPEWFNASLIQLGNTNDHVGIYMRNGQASENIKFDLDGSGGSSVVTLTHGMSVIVTQHPTQTAGSYCKTTTATGSTKNRMYVIDDASLRSGTNGIREINNMMYQCPYDIKKSAYAVVKDWTTSSMEINIAEFDNPNYAGTHGSTLTPLIVEQDDTTQIPIRISDTLIVGIPSDVNIPVADSEGSSAAVRNNFRKMTKYTTSDNWATDTTDDSSIRTYFGPLLYLSQRAGHGLDDSKIFQMSDESSFHVANTGYFYKFSFVYDGFQESPLGAARHIWSNGKQVKIPFCFNTDNFPSRVTAVRVYRASSVSSVNRELGGFYHFVGEIDITASDYSGIHTGTYTDGLSSAVNEGDEHANNYRLIYFTDSGASGATYETMSGLLEGMEDSNVKYKLSTQLNDSLFMANCAHHSQDTATNILYKSLPYKPSCVNWALDLLKLPWVPTAIKSYNGRIYVFNENETLKIDPTNMFIEDAFVGAGCLGPDSISVSDFGMMYCDNNNIYLHNGGQPVPVGDSILTSDSSIGYLDLLNTGSYSPKIAFDSKRKCFVLYLTTTRAWSYNVIRRVWNLWENPNLIGVLNGKKGEILGIDNSGGDLYHMYSSATLKDNWHWTSKRISMQHKTQKKKFYEATVAYTGDGSGDTPTITVYYDYATGATSTTDGGSETNIVKRDLAKEKKRLIQLKVQPGDATTEVDSIGITFRRFPKLVETS